MPNEVGRTDNFRAKIYVFTINMDKRATHSAGGYIFYLISL